MSSSRTETGSQPARSTTDAARWCDAQMGVSVAEGTIVEWRKRPGDWVEADEPVCDVTTDKIDVEIPSPASRPLASGSWSSRGHRRGGHAAGRDRRRGEARARRTRTEHLTADDSRTAPDAARASAPGGCRRRRGAIAPAFYSPVVRRIADKHGVDLAQVSGTGIGGRVRKKDVLAYIEAREGGRRGSARARACTSSPPTGRRGGAPQSAGRAAVPAAPVDATLGRRRRAARSRCRRCARRSPATWSESRRTAAHCTTIVEADFSRVVARRRRAAGADAAARRQPHLPGVRGPGDGRGARGAPEAERLVRRQTRSSTTTTSTWDRGRARRRPDRAGDPPGPAAQPRGHGRRDRRPRASAPGRSAGARRGPRRHLHDHQPGAVRGRARDADHQPAPGRDPRPRGDRQAARRGVEYRRRRRMRSRAVAAIERFDRDPPDDLPLHVLGPPGAGRRRRGPVPRGRSRIAWRTGR